MSIVLDQLTKRFEGVPVVNHVSLEIADGEFFVLLGPSGSGKSTILRMIAGLTGVDRGRIMLQGRDVTTLAPQSRHVGFVFQHYALFRHMTAAENIEFGLKIKKVAAAERKRRVDALLELVGLAGLGGRRPAQLSGGQQQRVALARALALQPSVMLLDEPFGALDARIRTELRRVVKRIHKDLGITTIFVTHDQEEAFGLADRLGVMNHGRLLEIGPPDELYLRPQTEFVATFLGTANLLLGECTEREVRVGPLSFPLGTETPPDVAARRVQVLFRPEDVALSAWNDDAPAASLGAGEVEEVVFAGDQQRLRLKLPALEGVRPIAPPVPFGSESMLVEAIRSQEQARGLPLVAGDRTWVAVRRIHALTHPGLSFLMITDGSAVSHAALGLGSYMARQAHARATVIGCGRDNPEVAAALQRVREALGQGVASLDVRMSPDAPGAAVAREAERDLFDLVVLGFPSDGFGDLLRQLLNAGDHHVMLVRESRPAISRALVCVGVSEPGKQDILFVARLLRHLGAEATLLSVVGKGDESASTIMQAERFLAGGQRTCALLGVPSRPLIRRGDLGDEIRTELASEPYDLLVLGAPLTKDDAEVALSARAREVLREHGHTPVLIVRSAVVSPAPHPAHDEV